jgi:hypothetical protein
MSTQSDTPDDTGFNGERDWSITITAAALVISVIGLFVLASIL